jgi:hypothetical protein
LAGLLRNLGLRNIQQKRRGFCNHLNAIGVRAHEAQKGRPEELFRHHREISIGLIHLQDPHLDWANVVQGNYRGRLPGDLLFFRTPGQPFYYRIWYGLYDPNLKISNPSLVFRSKRLRPMNIVGRAFDVSWYNELQPVELEPMTSDPYVKDHLIQSGVDVEVMAFPDGYWIISNREAGRPPSKRIWECYQAVAQGLKLSSKGLDPDKFF